MTARKALSPGLATAFEYAEAAAWAPHYYPKTRLRSQGEIIASAFAGALPQLDILALNRVIGLGVEAEVKPRHIDNIIAFYRAANSRRFFLPLSPNHQPPALDSWLQAAGFRPYNNWLKLARPLQQPIPRAKCKLRVARIGPDDRLIFGQIICQSFNWQHNGLPEWLSTTVGRPGFFHYLVYLQGLPVAAGALHVLNDIASLIIAGTLPTYRRLGAQSLLLQTRLEQAKALGCRTVLAETAEPTHGRAVISLHNLQRMGFELAYRRPNYLFEL